jgi:hypothetical protein
VTHCPRCGKPLLKLLVPTIHLCNPPKAANDSKEKKNDQTPA